MARTPIVLPQPLTDDQFNARLLSGTPVRITMSDDGPDDLGRRRFMLEMNQKHYLDGRMFAHGQCFHAVPSTICRPASSPEGRA